MGEEWVGGSTDQRIEYEREEGKMWVGGGGAEELLLDLIC